MGCRLAQRRGAPRRRLRFSRPRAAVLRPLLFLFCVLKLFVYDLRQLDVPSRILSFVVLGLFLLAASWIYTRFREQIRRLTGE